MDGMRDMLFRLLKLGASLVKCEWQYGVFALECLRRFMHHIWQDSDACVLLDLIMHGAKSAHATAATAAAVVMSAAESESKISVDKPSIDKPLMDESNPTTEQLLFFFLIDSSIDSPVCLTHF